MVALQPPGLAEHLSPLLAGHYLESDPAEVEPSGFPVGLVVRLFALLEPDGDHTDLFAGERPDHLPVHRHRHVEHALHDGLDLLLGEVPGFDLAFWLRWAVGGRLRQRPLHRIRGEKDAAPCPEHPAVAPLRDGKRDDPVLDPVEIDLDHRSGWLLVDAASPAPGLPASGLFTPSPGPAGWPGARGCLWVAENGDGSLALKVTR